MNKIINGILESLEAKYPDYNKYVEDVEQGFKPPCFVVNIINYDRENLLENERSYREKEGITVQVLFFPKETPFKRNEKREIAEHLPIIAKCVERIRINNKIVRATSSKSVIVDNTAQTIVTFDFNTLNKVTDNLMENLIERGVLVGKGKSNN